MQLLDPARDGERLAALSRPPERTAEELAATVEQMRGQAEAAAPGDLTAVAEIDPETAD